MLRSISATSPSDIWASGFANGATTFPIMEHWDGASWTLARTPHFSGVFNSVAAAGPDDAWAVGLREDTGTGFVEHWDGTTWRLVHDPIRGGINAISAASPTDVWAVGNNELFKRPITIHWDGTSWTRVRPAVPDPKIIDLLGVDALSSGHALLVGYYGGEGGGGLTDRPLERPQPTLGEWWNGTTWTQQRSASPLHTSELNAVSDVTDSDGWAVGDTGAEYQPTAMIEHWDGTRLTRANAPIPTGLSSFTSVDSDAASDAWAVGWATVDADHYTLVVEHWDGAAWTQD